MTIEIRQNPGYDGTNNAKKYFVYGPNGEPVGKRNMTGVISHVGLERVIINMEGCIDPGIFFDLTTKLRRRGNEVTHR